MQTNKQKCLHIKNLLERLSGVQDIGFRNRERFNSDLKKTYYKLCEEFTLSTLSIMAYVLGGYHHTTALHNLNEFKNLYNTEFFGCNGIYNEAKLILKREHKTRVEISEETPSTIEELNQKYLISSINTQQKSHSIIKRKSKRINELKIILLEVQSYLDKPEPKPISELYEIKNKIKFTLLK